MPKIYRTRDMSYKNLVELKNDKINQAEKILADAEVNKRELTEAEAEELAEIRDDVKRIKEALKIGDELDDSKEKQPKQEPTPDGGGDKQPTQEQQERRAFENFIRGRAVHERAGELTKTDNGSVIPTTIAQQIIKKVYDVSPILETSRASSRFRITTPRTAASPSRMPRSSPRLPPATASSRTSSSTASSLAL